MERPRRGLVGREVNCVFRGKKSVCVCKSKGDTESPEAGEVEMGIVVL